MPSHRKRDEGGQPNAPQINRPAKSVKWGLNVRVGFREPEVAVGRPERIAELISDYAQAGAKHVILSIPDPYGEVDPKALEKASPILDRL